MRPRGSLAFDVPVDVLLSDAYNEQRRKLITDRASMELRPGTVTGFGKPVDDPQSEDVHRP